MSPEARRLVLHASAFALVRATFDSTDHAARAHILRGLILPKDAPASDALRMLSDACLALCDAMSARDGALLERANLRLREAVKSFLDQAARTDAQRYAGGAI